ncbi:hypothetical protein BDF20DRAFT_846869 [Mycotypha africana]|uniref:uncharacterized protein n=1 Tax=Mycotypha africana TaxID=64632 RepID=UPI002300860E|nr:uncharacterized protein BDF20DRAFT_846869 [Mycotypha africana]KAI8991866.1 hypothetical protein BDF20DRAFT_846869 [Mycotypha africana]
MLDIKNSVVKKKRTHSTCKRRTSHSLMMSIFFTFGFFWTHKCWLGRVIPFRNVLLRFGLIFSQIQIFVTSVKMKRYYWLYVDGPSVMFSVNYG